MRVPIVAVAAACLAWGVASAQMGPAFAQPALRVDSPQAAPPPHATATRFINTMPPRADLCDGNVDGAVFGRAGAPGRRGTAAAESQPAGRRTCAVDGCGPAG